LRIDSRICGLTYVNPPADEPQALRSPRGGGRRFAGNIRGSRAFLAYGPLCSLHRGEVMHLSNESLLAIVFVGIVAGWLAGLVMRGGGFGLIGDLIIGLVGAFIGDWLLPRLHIHLGVGIVTSIVNAFVGAVLLLLILRLINGGWGYRRRWSRW